MNARGLIAFARGSVRAECAGGFFERFLSEALAEGVEPFDVVVKKGAARFSVEARDYARLRGAARRSQCRMRVVQKRGLLFSARKVKNLHGLCVGILVMLAVAAALGELVVAVDIKGSSTASRAEITASLERCGVYVGMPQSQVDVRLTEQRLQLDNRRLAWAAVNLSYGRATVEVRDKLETRMPQSRREGAVVVARRDAQITEITLVSGEALVSPGEVVSAGQRLVEPTAALSEASWAARAEASVRARTYYRERFETGYHRVFRERTGLTSRRVALSLGELSTPALGRESPYRWFDTLKYSEPLTIFNFDLPVKINTTEYFEISQRSERLSAARAEALLSEICGQYEKTNLAGADILYKNAEFLPTDSGWTLEVEYICEEEIAEYFYP